MKTETYYYFYMGRCMFRPLYYITTDKGRAAREAARQKRPKEVKSITVELEDLVPRGMPMTRAEYIEQVTGKALSALLKKDVHTRIIHWPEREAPPYHRPYVAPVKPDWSAHPNRVEYFYRRKWRVSIFDDAGAAYRLWLALKLPQGRKATLYQDGKVTGDA